MSGAWRGSPATAPARRSPPSVEKLAALVPPPRFNLVRYHGVLAPAAHSRSQIVPANPLAEADSASHPGCRARQAKRGECRSEAGIPRKQPGPPRPRNYSWAELMRRVFAVDVLEFPRCFGRMRIVAAIHPPEAIRAILVSACLRGRHRSALQQRSDTDGTRNSPERRHRAGRDFSANSALQEGSGCMIRTSRAPEPGAELR